MSAKPFGPTALATPANALTLVRLVAAPVLAVLIAAFGPSSWALWAGWGALAFSDTLDGHVARRHGPTRSGAFLDPLADKFLVLGALIALAYLGVAPPLAVALIALREAALVVFRTYASQRGVSIPARPLAKAKAWLQDIAIGLFLFPPTAHHLTLCRAVLWASVVLTIVSGLQYFLDGRKTLQRPAQLARTRG